MKSLNLTYFVDPNKKSIHTKDRMFTVWLNFGLTFYFSDKKKMLSFIADLNRMLNINLVELNTIYCNMFTVYRDLWFFLDGTDCYLPANDILEIEKLFDKIYHNSTNQYKNVRVYKNFLNMIEIMKEILKNLRTVCVQKKISISLMKIDNLLKNLDKINAELLNFKPAQKEKK